MAGRGGTGGNLRLLVCRVGSRVCAVPLEHVSEIMRPLPAEPLANMPAFLEGLALIRGRPIPVVDAGRLLGARTHERAITRYVAIKLGERSVALAVDAVVGVRTVEERALLELPALLRESDSELVSALGRLDAELLLVLEHTRLLPDATWQMLQEGRST